MERSFYSKILLFGEYSIIKNSKAITIPYPMFGGQLLFPDHKFDRSQTFDSNHELKSFALYLSKLENSSKLNDLIDTSAFRFDVEQGLYFNSSIPQGYGLGSSGALCAAVFDRYRQTEQEISLDRLRNLFKLMESHFHGSSSGIDPLISYLGVPLLNTSDGIEKLSLSSPVNGNRVVFLINTKRARRTEPLVNLFLEKCKNQDFDNFVENELKQTTNDCVDAFMNGDFDNLYESFSKLSEYQYEHFLPMIPNLFRDMWKKGLDSKEDGEFRLKICGAGGGGYLLGITKDFEKTKKYFLQLR